MSGIYLILWDDNRDRNILKATRGGWPHVTLTHTGKALPLHVLTNVANEALKKWALKKLTLVHASVSSWEDKTGHIRHDVLLSVKEINEINALRNELLTYRFPYMGIRFNTREPHVTTDTFDTVEEAFARAKLLNENFLPFPVSVTGVAID